MSRHSRPLWLGVLLAPWVGGLPLAVAVVGSGRHGSGFVEAITSVAGTVLVSVPVAYAGMALLGLPFALWLRARQRLCLAYLIPAGFVLAGLPFAVYLGATEGAVAAADVFWRMGLAGGLVALAFGVLVGARPGPGDAANPTP